MITQKFPFLLPVRIAQRKMFFYVGMRLDGRTYAKTMGAVRLPHRVFSADSPLYNADTGFDMVYQENKVFNLRLVAKKLDGLLIRPGETFSFWRAAQKADKHTPYKDGLVLKNGKLCISGAGGLCQMSNLLFWVFLHSPLTIVERHTHRTKGFPVPGTSLEGVDATISEGWLDLKMKNETDTTFQIGIAFDDENITGSIYADRPLSGVYEIDGRNLTYFRQNGAVYQEISIWRRKVDIKSNETLAESLLYTNRSTIGYQLPDDTIIEERGTDI